MVTIHEKTAQTFDTLGLGALLPSSCIVTEELNGAYELEMEHPYDDGGKWKRIERGRILYASTPRGMQPFRIYYVKPDMDGITVNARHIFYDLLDNQCGKISFSGTAADALEVLQSAFAYAMPFSFSTDISISGTMETGRMNPVQALLSDDDETDSFVKGFGGEILRDHFNVFIKTSMGQDRDVAVRYGKNLVGLEVTQDESEVETRIQCYGKNGSATVDSPYLGAYIYPKIHTLEDTNKTVSELKKEAQALLDGGADLPMVNIKVDFIPLSKTVEYKNYAILEEVQLGDIVTVINQKINFSKRARVISYEWDCILEQYNEVELGDFMPTLASSVTSGVRSGHIASNAYVNASAVYAALQDHMNDKDNPHQVTADQIGYSGGDGGGSAITGAVESVNEKTGAVNLTAEDIGAMPADTAIPTKTSDLTNDSGFLTEHQSLAGYATENYVQQYVNDLDARGVSY
ncbi:MAG: phage tail spike protein [Anaerotignum sp.]